MYKNYKDLEEQVIKHSIGAMYNYLNNIEDNIYSSLTSEKIIHHFNLSRHTNYDDRCSCPLHNGNNKTSLTFYDDSKKCTCYGEASCGTKTYIQFIAAILNTKNLNEAKIYAANNFSNINLGFNSIDDYKDQIRRLVKERFDKTKSLDLKDYYDISILPNGFNSTSKTIKLDNTNSISNETNKKVISKQPEENKTFMLQDLDIDAEVRKMDADSILNKGQTAYINSITLAYKSKLIQDFKQRKDKLNSPTKLHEFIKFKYNISADIVDNFGLIYFDKENQSLLNYGDFSTLNYRVLFPFRDHETGMIVGYQCRNAKLQLNERAKYINITDYKDTLITNKDGYTRREFEPLSIGNFLFNLYELKEKRISSLWITEGVADTIKLLALGYDSVSPGQSNLTDHQIQLLAKYFGKDIQINLFFDTDISNRGQNNSISIAYKLWQYGFRKVNIIRTFIELGKDITDCSVKLQDDILLTRLIELWRNNSYKFIPASNEDLNELMKSNFYTREKIFQVDPRNINEEILFMEELKEIMKITGPINTKNINLLKKGSLTTFKELLLDLKGRVKVTDLDTCDSTEIINKLESTESSTTSSSEVKVESDQPNSAEEQQKINSLNRLSNGQVYILRKKFDWEMIKTIDKYLNDNQIKSIVFHAKANKDFDILSYLMSSPYKKEHSINNKTTLNSNSPSIAFDADFIPIYDPDECPPF